MGQEYPWNLQSLSIHQRGASRLLEGVGGGCGEERESALWAGKDPELSLMSDTSNKSCIFPKSEF